MSDKYNNPWREKDAKAAQAVRVRDYMARNFDAEISDCIAHTCHQGIIRGIERISTEAYAKKVCPDKRPGPIVVTKSDSVSAAFEQEGKVAILNFASYKNPGGMFLEGSMAQEESLCHESALYNILSSERLVQEFYEPNRRRLNRSLYNDNLLYTPAVPFVRGKQFRTFDVITCAAPNKGAAQRYQHVSADECDRAMRNRIKSVLLAAISNKVDTVILGAFGCGVFKNDPRTVAEIFKDELEGFPCKAVFAVPGDKYSIFEDTFADRL